MSYVAYNAATRSAKQLEKASQRLSTGLRVNSAADDAAGLAISEKMTAQIRGLDQASRNAQDGMSLLQTAEGALNEIHSMLQRMRELSIQAANGTLTAEDRDYIQLEINELTRQITDIANQTQFNKKKLLNGDSSILWSTSMSDIRVLVGGTLLKKDIFGQTINTEGNYKITFETVQAGSEQVQKSNILYLKHGTLDTNTTINAASGINNFGALNMVEGVWRVDTRTEPFGGVTYWHGNAVSDKGDVGAELITNGISNLAPGEYYIRLSDNVPMMVDITDALAADTVDDVYMSSRGATSDFDAKFTVVNSIPLADSASDVYRNDISGTANNIIADGATVGTFDPTTDAIGMDTNNSNDLNVFTRYEVISTDSRDLITEDLEISSAAYTLSNPGTINVNLEYQALPGSEIEATVDYITKESTITITDSTFYFDATDTFGFVVYDENGNKIAGVNNPFAMGNHRTMQDAQSFINRVLLNSGDGTGIATGVGVIGDINDLTKYIDIKYESSGLSQNSTFELDFAFTSPSPSWFDPTKHTIVFTGTVSEKNGFDGAYGLKAGTDPLLYPAGKGTIETGSLNAPVVVDGSAPKDYQNSSIVLTGLGGKTIQEVHADLSDINSSNGKLLYERGISVVINNSGGMATLTFTANGSPDKRYDMKIANTGLAAELGFDVTFDHSTSSSKDSIAKELGKALTGSVINVTGMNLTNIAGALNSLFAANSGYAGSGTYASVVPLTDLSHLQINKDATNSTEYQINFKDTVSSDVLSELFGGDFSIKKDVNKSSVNVYENADINISIAAGSSMAAIEQALSSGISISLGADGLTWNDGFDAFTYNATLPLGSETITMSNNSTSGYKIKIDDDGVLTGTAIGEAIWGGEKTVSRTGGTESSKSSNDPSLSSLLSINAGSPITISINNQDIWNAIETINIAIATHPELSGLTAAWYDGTNVLPTPPAETDPGYHTGKIVLVNSTSSTISVAQTNVTSGAIFSSLSFTIASGNSSDESNSNVLQAHDNITLEVAWEGNSVSGGIVSGSTAPGGVVIWEGDTSNTNKNNLNSATISLGGDFYEFFSTKDNVSKADGFSDFAVGDSWIVYTSAAAQTGFDSVTVDLADGKYTDAGNNGGKSDGIKYVFSNGVLDANTAGGNPITINQMIRIDNLDYETLEHNIVFGGTVSNVEFSYGERANGGDMGEWAVGGSNNPANATPYYAQAYSGDQTTYYIANGTSINSIVGPVRVNKMNDVNGSLLFIYNAAANNFTVKTETADRISGPATPGSTTIAASDLNGTTSLSINGVNFDGISVNTAGLTDGDMFVINVAAAAKLDGINLNPSSSFVSNENISIYADLARSGGTWWDSTSQYRFADGKAASGDYEGFIIDRLTGAEKPGVLTLDIGTLNSNSGVGIAGNGDSDAFWIKAQVNNQGSLVPGAGGLVTSVYIKDLEKDATKGVIDYIPEIKYAEIKGGSGSVNDPGLHNDYNASVIFDFLGYVDDDPSKAARFRIQAHVMDIDGNYAYLEDEERDLIIGQNATGGQFVIFSATNPTDPDYCWRDTVALPNFTGLYFDSFNLAGTWEAGDRFTLSLMASGALDGGGVDTSMDEVTFISDLRGTALPHSFRFNEGAIDGETTDFHIYQLANNTYLPNDSVHFADDQVMDGTVSLDIGALATAPEAVEFTSSFMKGIDAGVAHYYSRPEDVKQFWNANGVFMLEDEPEKLTVKLGDRETTIYIDGQVELGKLARRMSEQIWLNLIQGQGEITKDSIDKLDEDDRDKDEIVQFVNSVPGESSNEAVFGTLVAHSVIPGANYKLEFFGSEELMKALAFREIVSAKDTVFEMTVEDAHSGRRISGPTQVVAGQNIENVVAPGVTLAANAIMGINEVSYKDAAGLFGTNLSAGATIERFVHLADNALVLQIGANQGEDAILVLGDMTAKALGIQNLEVRNRESAARSVTRVDDAIRKVSRQRAIIGAQINRLEHAVNAITVASTNLSDSRAKITDTDFASEMLDFTRLNILRRAGLLMQAQANQVNNSVLTLMR
jgi:flagellin-like hook-associated protein FlgL